MYYCINTKSSQITYNYSTQLPLPVRWTAKHCQEYSRQKYKKVNGIWNQVNPKYEIKDSLCVLRNMHGLSFWSLRKSQGHKVQKCLLRRTEMPHVNAVTALVFCKKGIAKVLSQTESQILYHPIWGH